MKTSTPPERDVVLPQELLTPARFDICAKHTYARLREQSPSLQWGRLVYENHILAINHGFENQRTPYEKAGIHQFFVAFDAVLDSIKKVGFDDTKGVIPVGENGVLINGAHRTAACLFYGVSPTIARGSVCHLDCSWDYLQKRGLDEEILDYMALEYSRLRTDCFLAIIWPSASAQIELIESILSERCKIAFRKKTPAIGKNAPQNIIRQVYPSASWLGRTKDGFKGAKMKARPCFSGGDFFYVLLLQAESFEDLVEVKEKARAKIGIGNHSLHITDSHAETIRMAKMFFNANSVYFLNHSTPIDSSIFHERLLEYEHAVGEREDFAVHGSSVMEAFGIREAGDLDYISRSGEILQTNDPKISLGNEKTAYSDFSLDELLFDPRRYFYFYGVKFVDLSILERMKILRGEKKDVQDVALIKDWREESIKWKFFQVKRHVRGFFPKYKRKTFLKMLRRRIRNWCKNKIENS